MEATSYTDFHRYSSMISPYVQIIEIRIRTRAFDSMDRNSNWTNLSNQNIYVSNPLKFGKKNKRKKNHRDRVRFKKKITVMNC